ncbi:DUF3085 domain-containing protein [Catelliglobosispora koreensis]|uniref:DUF3085 domain-containing protein n=1 Tax=Catelliglobosispora koreensis TaxID=129052 RepID=UPI00036C06AE|nr:DUF3085 domain-containing protein [Catelliglobosispora koreensis]
MMRLYFPLTEVLTLAEHAAAAPEHSPSFTQHEDGKPGDPSLVWVKDDGTYLMTNGIPGLLHDPANPESNVVVYAEGWGTGTGPDLNQIDDIGGDDFVEHIPLDERYGEFPTFLEALRAYLKAGYAWLIIESRADLTFDISMAKGVRR